MPFLDAEINISVRWSLYRPALTMQTPCDRAFVDLPLSRYRRTITMLSQVEIIVTFISEKLSCWLLMLYKSILKIAKWRPRIIFFWFCESWSRFPGYSVFLFFDFYVGIWCIVSLKVMLSKIQYWHLFTLWLSILQREHDVFLMFFLLVHSYSWYIDFL